MLGICYSSFFFQVFAATSSSSIESAGSCYQSPVSEYRFSGRGYYGVAGNLRSVSCCQKALLNGPSWTPNISTSFMSLTCSRLGSNENIIRIQKELLVGHHRCCKITFPTEYSITSSKTRKTMLNKIPEDIL